MSPRMLACAALSLGLLLAAPASVRSEESPVKLVVAKMLDGGWQNTIKARAAADEQYEQLKKQAPADIRVTHAYALIQVKQRDYAQAGKLFDEVLASSKTDRHALRAKAWLSVITKNYTSALAELDRLSQLPIDSQDDSDAQDQHLEVARFLGRMIGFLEGPVADAVNAAQRDQAKKRILARLSEPRQTAFEEGRANVLATFNSLGAEKEVSEEKAKVVAEEERDKLLADLEARKAKNAARRAQIGPRRAELQSELQGENDRFAREERPLATEFNATSAQAAGDRREFAFVLSDIARIRAQLDRERDPVLRERLLRDLDRASLFAARVEGNLVAVERRAAGVSAQLADLQRRQAQVQQRLGGELTRLANELASLDKLEKRSDVEITKAGKPAVGAVGRSRSISAQAAALTTYEEFPLETEKQRLLDSYE